MNRIMALNSNTYHGFSLTDAFNGMEEAELTHVELTATKGWTEHVFPDMSFESLWLIKEEMRKRRIVPFALSGHTNLMDRERIPDFIMNMRLAHFFGCRYILSSVGEAHLKDEAELSSDEIADEVKKLIPYLREYDLTLCIENHGRHGTGQIINAIVKEIDSDRVKINYDTANAVFYGNVDIMEDMLACIDQIGFVHLKDKSGPWDEWNFPALGSGDLDLIKFIDTLKAHGNNSPLSIEIEFTKDGPKDLEAVHEALKQSLDYLKGQGLSGGKEEFYD